MNDHHSYVTLFNIVVSLPFLAWVAWRRMAQTKAAATAGEPELSRMPPHSARIFWAGVFGIVVLWEAVMIYDLLAKA